MVLVDVLHDRASIRIRQHIEIGVTVERDAQRRVARDRRRLRVERKRQIPFTARWLTAVRSGVVEARIQTFDGEVGLGRGVYTPAVRIDRDSPGVVPSLTQP
jgi:hypothetical protein